MIVSRWAAVTNYCWRWLLTMIIMHSSYACWVVHSNHSRTSCWITKEPCMNFCWVPFRYKYETFYYQIDFHDICRQWLKIFQTISSIDTYEYALSSSYANFEETSADAINSQPRVSWAYFSNMSIVDFACMLYALFHAWLDQGVPDSNLNQNMN